MNLNLSWYKLLYILQETGRSYRRGGWMNWAAVSTLALMLFLVGVSYLIHRELVFLLQGMGSILELTAYLKPDADPLAVQATVSQWAGIETVRIESGEGAWQQFLTDLGQFAPETQAILGENPFLDSLKIATTDQSLVPSIAEQLTNLGSVDSVWYGRDLILQLQELSQGLNHFSFIAILILTTIALVVTYTTIRLVTGARSAEMEIMSLVGASKRWIYTPILVQGMAFGVLAVTIAAGILLVCSTLLGNRLEMWDLPLAPRNLGLFPLVFVLFGVGTSTIGTWLSILENQKSSASSLQ